MQDGVLDGGEHLQLEAAVHDAVAGHRDLVGGCGVGHVAEVGILNGEAELRLLIAGDVGHAADGAQRVGLLRLEQELVGNGLREQVLAVAEVCGVGRDGAEAFIGLLHVAGQGIAVEGTLRLDHILLGGHGAVSDSLGGNSEALLFLKAVMLGLEHVVTGLQLIAVSLLGVEVFFGDGGIGCFLSQPVGIGKDGGLQSGHFLFEFEQIHF